MKHITTLFACMFALAACGCATKIVRTERPESVELISPVDDTMRYVGTDHVVRIPAGMFTYVWEDESYWYYENPSFEIYVQVRRRDPRVGWGGFAIRKHYNEIALFTYQDAGAFRKAGAGELVVLMQKKRNGKLLFFEFMVVPEPIRERLRLVGSSPL